MRARVMYPNRTIHFGIQTGLIDPDEYAANVEADRLKRLAKYIDGLVVESLKDFKEKFGI